MKRLCFVLLVMPTPALAETPAPCPVPAELGGWGAMTPVMAARDAAGAGMLAIGRGTRAALPLQRDVVFVVAPGKPEAADARGGLLSFTVAQAGRYRVALGAAAWIDVMMGGKALPSAAHAHGPDCSGVRKMVDFDLKPGPYLLQISGARDPAVEVMVARLG